jgi:hypothetical protein
MFDRKIRFFTVRFLNRNGSKRMSDIVDLSPGMPARSPRPANLLWDEGPFKHERGGEAKRISWPRVLGPAVSFDVIPKVRRDA